MSPEYRYHDTLLSMLHRIRTELHTRFAHDGASWLLLQQIVIAPLSLITTVILAKLLSISDYGYYKYALSLLSIFSAFGLAGIFSIAQLNIQRGQDDFFDLALQYRKFSRWIPSLLALATTLYYAYHHNYFLSSIFAISIFYYFFIETYSLYGVATAGKGHFRMAALFEILNYCISYIPPIITVFLFRGNTNVVIFVFITTFACQFIFRYLSYRYVKTFFGFQEHTGKNITEEQRTIFKKEIVSYSFNNGISSVMSSAQSVIVFNRLGASDNAIYSLAITFANFAATIITAPMGKILLSLGHMKSNDVAEHTKRNYITTQIRMYAVLTFFVTISLIILLPFVYHTLFQKYIAYEYYAMVYALTLLPICLNPALHYFYVKKDFKRINTIQLASGLTTLLALFFVSSIFGIMGVIVTQVVMGIVNNIIWTVLCYHEL